MPEANIGDLDRNLRVSKSVDAPDLTLFDVRKPPFRIYGLYDPQNQPQFKRLPDEVALATSEPVSRLHLHTAGGRVRFSTDSPYVVIKAVMPHVDHMSHMPLTGSAGFDLYLDSPNGQHSMHEYTFVPPCDMTDGYESKFVFESEGKHCVTINFPLYNPVTALYIGVKKGSLLAQGAPYQSELPIVYYGSSITQGGCASRPGNAYQAMVGRAIGYDYVNLGFSGNGRGEDSIIAHMASLPMAAFVSDYDYNSPGGEHLRVTHRKLYEAVRAAHPTIPYIMMSAPEPRPAHRLPWGKIIKTVERREIILENFHRGFSAGDQNLYFIDGSGLFRGNFGDCCTVDYTHPNDLGFSRMAEPLIALFKTLIIQGKL